MEELITSIWNAPAESILKGVMVYVLVVGGFASVPVFFVGRFFYKTFKRIEKTHNKLGF